MNGYKQDLKQENTKKAAKKETVKPAYEQNNNVITIQDQGQGNSSMLHSWS